ncbi:hypothetical protein ABKN59_004822 [Abortiporus biennis]
MLKLNRISPLVRLGYSISQVIPNLQSLLLQFDQQISGNYPLRFPDVVQGLLDLLNHTPAPRLESLRIVPHFPPTGYPQNFLSSEMISIFCGYTPRLISLHLENCLFSWGSNLFCNTLRSLAIVNIPDPLELQSKRDLFLSTIGELQLLESIRLKFLADHTWRLQQGYYIDSQTQDGPIISLPNLRQLHCGGELGTIGLLLGSISMPSIKGMFLFCRRRTIPTIDDDDISPGKEFTYILSRVSHIFQGFSSDEHQPRSMVLNFGKSGTYAKLVVRNIDSVITTPGQFGVQGGGKGGFIFRMDVSMITRIVFIETAFERLLSIIPEYIPVHHTDSLTLVCPDSITPSHRRLNRLWGNVTSLTICGPRCANALLPLLHQPQPCPDLSWDDIYSPNPIVDANPSTSGNQSSSEYLQEQSSEEPEEEDAAPGDAMMTPFPHLKYLTVVMPLKDSKSLMNQNVYKKLGASLRKFISHRAEACPGSQLDTIYIKGTKKFHRCTFLKVEEVGKEIGVQVIRDLNWTKDSVELRRLGCFF